MTHITNSMSHTHITRFHDTRYSTQLPWLISRIRRVMSSVVYVTWLIHMCDRTHITNCQHTATHCNTLQHTAAHCNTLQHTAATATHCSTLQHTAATATHCSTLQHTATHCSTLQRTAAHCSTLQHTAAHCSTLQLIATHCNTLQYTATLCNTLQHVAHAKEPCRTYHSVMSHTHRGFMSHIWMSHVSAESIGGRHGHSQQRVPSLHNECIMSLHSFLNHVSAQWRSHVTHLNEWFYRRVYRRATWSQSATILTWLKSRTQRVMSPQSLSAGDMVTVSNYRDMTQITNSTSHVSAESIGGRHGHSQQRPRRCMQKGECAPHRPYQQVKALNTWIDPKTRKDLNTWKQTSKHEKRPLNLQRRVCPTLSVSAGKSP